MLDEKVVMDLINHMDLQTLRDFALTSRMSFALAIGEYHKKMSEYEFYITTHKITKYYTTLFSHRKNLWNASDDTATHIKKDEIIIKDNIKDVTVSLKTNIFNYYHCNIEKICPINITELYNILYNVKRKAKLIVAKHKNDNHIKIISHHKGHSKILHLIHL